MEGSGFGGFNEQRSEGGGYELGYAWEGKWEERRMERRFAKMSQSTEPSRSKGHVLGNSKRRYRRCA